MERAFAVKLHDQRVVVRARGAVAVRVADYVCGAMATSLATDAPRLVLEEANDTLTFTKDGVTIARGAHAGDAAALLMRELTQCLIWDYASGLALHAAFLDVGGLGVLFPAASGVGKSTLVSYCAGRGAGFFTDELVFVPLREQIAYAQTRPAHLKPGSMFLLDRFPVWAAHPAVWACEEGTLLGPSLLGARPSPSPVAAVIVPRYRAGAALTLERLSAGAAAFALLGALLNARNLDEAGVPATAQLAAALPVWRLDYDDLEDAWQAIWAQRQSVL